VVSHREADLRRQSTVKSVISRLRPDVIYLAAAKVGGIEANRSRQGEFLYDNLMIGANVIESARIFGIEKVVTLGSNCIYPRDAVNPVKETDLLTGPLEKTNEGYAIAKIAMIELGRFYRDQYGMDIISLMPCNLYGPRDKFEGENTHVFPALIRKVWEAKVNGYDHIELWGTGKARREFLHSDDLADAVVFSTKYYSEGLHLNVGSGKDCTIEELALMIADVAQWEGSIRYKEGTPDGTPQKLLDIDRLHRMGWDSKIKLRDGIASTYRWYSSVMKRDD